MISQFNFVCYGVVRANNEEAAGICECELCVISPVAVLHLDISSVGKYCY